MGGGYFLRFTTHFSLLLNNKKKKTCILNLIPTVNHFSQITHRQEKISRILKISVF